MSSLEANPDPGVSTAGLSHADTEVLVRAVERNAVVLMDDLSGRNHAKSLGLRVIGTLGVVELAARRHCCRCARQSAGFSKPTSVSRRISIDR